MPIDEHGFFYELAPEAAIEEVWPASQGAPPNVERRNRVIAAEGGNYEVVPQPDGTERWVPTNRDSDPVDRVHCACGSDPVFGTLCAHCGRITTDVSTHVHSVCGCPICFAMRELRTTQAVVRPIDVSATVTVRGTDGMPGPTFSPEPVLPPGATVLFKYQPCADWKEGDQVSHDFIDGVFVTKESGDRLRARLKILNETSGAVGGAWATPNDLRRIAHGLLRAADLLEDPASERPAQNVWERLKKPEVG